MDKHDDEKLADKKLDDISGGVNRYYWVHSEGPYTGKSGKKYMIMWNQDATEYGVFEQFALVPAMKFSFYSEAWSWIEWH